MRAPRKNSSSTRTIRSCSSFSVASTPSAAPPANATAGAALPPTSAAAMPPATSPSPMPLRSASRLVASRVRADEGAEAGVHVLARRGRVQAADQRAHAVAHDAVDRMSASFSAAIAPMCATPAGPPTDSTRQVRRAFVSKRGDLLVRAAAAEQPAP